MNDAAQKKLPLEERPVTIHIFDDDGMEVDRENVALATLSWRCSKSGTALRCPLGVEPGQTCPVASKCHEATPEAWARFVRLEENRLLAPQWWREARPAEAVWPEIFLGREKESETCRQ